MIGHAQPSVTMLLEERGQVAPEPRVHYLRHPFTVPEGATRVQVRVRFHKQRLCQLFLALFDPQGYGTAWSRS